MQPLPKGLKSEASHVREAGVGRLQVSASVQGGETEKRGHNSPNKVCLAGDDDAPMYKMRRSVLM